MEIAKYEDIRIGQHAEYVRTVTSEDIEMFGQVSGDYNPLHFNEDWAKTTMFKGRIAHGILTATYVSTVIGMKLPGPGAIYMSQSMKFRRPVRIGDTITARVEVIGKNDEKELLMLKTVCINQEDKVVLDGDAVVTLMRMDRM
ncbi:MAG: MaoC family dehydratase [Candidatus Thorarchaeota archaeon]|nr:MaoC family dehydratase [Candidatus Thorarchaeota archaeon]